MFSLPHIFFPFGRWGILFLLYRQISDIAIVHSFEGFEFLVPSVPFLHRTSFLFPPVPILHTCRRHHKSGRQLHMKKRYPQRHCPKGYLSINLCYPVFKWYKIGTNSKFWYRKCGSNPHKHWVLLLNILKCRELKPRFLLTFTTMHKPLFQAFPAT